MYPVYSQSVPDLCLVWGSMTDRNGIIGIWGFIYYYKYSYVVHMQVRLIIKEKYCLMKKGFDWTFSSWRVNEHSFLIKEIQSQISFKKTWKKNICFYLTYNIWSVSQAEI